MPLLTLYSLVAVSYNIAYTHAKLLDWIKEKQEIRRNSIFLLWGIDCDLQLKLSIQKKKQFWERKLMSLILSILMMGIDTLLKTICWGETHKINHFKVNNSVAFSVFIMLYNHHLYPVVKHFHHSKLKPLTHLAHLHCPLCTQPLATTTMPSVPVDLSKDISCKWNHTACDLLCLTSFT